MAKTDQVRILHGALDESPVKGAPSSIVLRGVVDQITLRNLKWDDYQREQAQVTSKGSIWEALVKGDVLPDIELGMRSEDFATAKDGAVVCTDTVYIIDGLQRVTNAAQYLIENPDATVRLGCTLHFNTTKEWERERFRILNSLRTKVAPSVLMRNARETSPAVDLLYNLCSSADFVMRDRVSWNQKMARGELLTALNLGKIAASLHNHKFGAGRTSLYPVINILDQQLGLVGTVATRQNVKAFYDLVEECWGVRHVQYSGATHMRSTFLRVLARILSDHHDFWLQPDEKRLVVNADIRRKLGLLKPQDPTIAMLASGSGKAHWTLYAMMRDHINSGKRTKRLRSRNPGAEINLDIEEEEAA